MKHKVFSSLALTLFVSACEVVGPEYQRPNFETPSGYNNANAQETTDPKIKREWWKVFNDEKLNELQQTALIGSPTLQAAASRVMQARASSTVVKSQFYPVITFDPSVDRTRTSENIGRANDSTTVTTLRVPFDFSYELDVWGRVRRSVEAADASVQATADDFGVVLLTLTADIAQNYFTLRSLDAQDQILNRNAELYQRQIDLTQIKFRAGLVGKTDVLQGQTLLDSTLAQISETRRQRAEAEHALALLIGKPPGALKLDPNPLTAEPPIIPAGLPADILRQRPDVSSAEHNLMAANAAIGVAEASLLPTIRLTGAAGYASSELKNTFDWGSRIWSIGAGLTAPIFEGGRLSAELERAKARYQELRANYQQAILVSFREVEDSLSNLHLYAEAAQFEARAVDSAREYLRLAEIQYRGGLVGYLQVIDADRALLIKELSAAQTLNQRLVSTVLLIKALGGGWTAEEEEKIEVPVE